MANQCNLVADLSEDDVLSAMHSMQGYVEVTPGTFREICALAPAGLGAAVLPLAALVVENMPKNGRYPAFRF